MLFQIVLVFAVLIAVFAILVAMQPPEFRVTRAAIIPASPATLFDLVNNLHKWEAWSPWAKLDPNAKQRFDGPEAGTGAVFHWAGNNKVGEGIMTIVESRPDNFVKLKLEFLRPFKAVNSSEFSFTPEGNNTNVTWSMYGKNNFMGKVMGLVMNCDKMVGGQFEKGLIDMARAAEKN